MDLRVTLSNIEYLEYFSKQNIDGVIVGLDFFSDRFNKYFSIEELKEIIEIANGYNINVYVNLNTMIEENDLVKLRFYMNRLYELNVKGIYFNDFAVLNIADESGIKHKMIYQADTLITNSLDAIFYMNQGIKGIVVAKEITLKELLKMGKRCNNLELVIHGRINLSYSKRKFLTNYFNHIQKQYDVVDNYDLKIKEETRDTKMPIVESKYGTSIYSDMSLLSFNEYNELKKNYVAGIIDDIFMAKDELFESIDLYNKVDNLNSEKITNDFINKYIASNYGSCFYYDKTTKKKEEV